jgi:hypothetical protein
VEFANFLRSDIQKSDTYQETYGDINSKTIPEFHDIWKAINKQRITFSEKGDTFTHRKFMLKGRTQYALKQHIFKLPQKTPGGNFDDVSLKPTAPHALQQSYCLNDLIAKT